MTGLLKLAADCDQLVSKFAATANDAAKDAATVIVEDLARETPVDVGEALSNWQVSLNAPIDSIIPAYVPSPRGRMRNGVWTHSVDPSVTRSANAPAALAIAKQVIASKQPGEPIFITNSTPQIDVLDRGSSTQTPRDFVMRAIILGRVIVDKIRRLR